MSKCFCHLNGYEVKDATARKDIAHLKNYITPQSFGAIGDGITDDAPAIRQAIQYATENNVKLLFNKGRYLLNSSVALASNLVIVGNVDAVIVGKGFITQANLNCENIVIDGLTFELTDENRNTLYNINNLTLRNLIFNNCAGFGIYDTTNFVIDNIFLNKTILGFSLYRCTHGLLSNFRGEDVTEVIDFAGCKHCSVNGVIATDITRNHEKQDEVIDLGQCEDITIVNVHSIGHYRGILIKNEYVADTVRNLGGIHIENCVFEDIAGSGICLMVKDIDEYEEFFNKGFFIKNVTIKSTIEYSRGIMINNYSENETNTFDIFDIDSVFIDVNDCGITTQVTNPTISVKGKFNISNSYIKGNMPLGLYFANRGCVIENTVFVCTGNSYAFRITKGDGIIIRDCELYGGSASKLENCKNTSIINNKFSDTLKTGVSFAYDDTFNDDLLNINVCKNLFTDLVSYGVALELSNSSSKSLCNIKFEDNNIFIKEGSSAYGVLLTTTELFKRVVLNRNTHRNLTVFIGGSSISNADAESFINTDNIAI